VLAVLAALAGLTRICAFLVLPIAGRRVAWRAQGRDREALPAPSSILAAVALAIGFGLLVAPQSTGRTPLDKACGRQNFHPPWEVVDASCAGSSSTTTRCRPSTRMLLFIVWWSRVSAGCDLVFALAIRRS
jgi:hypothetical protein